jgi:hypothetical protein
VRVFEPGRDPVEQVITLARGERIALDIALPAASHPVELQTIPGDASVFVDGAQILGLTPLTLRLGDDDFHEVRVEKLGYEPETRMFKPDDRDPVVSLTLRAEREPRGLVMVDSATTADVWIDGRNTGFVAPTVAIQVAAGVHVIELRESSGRRSAPVRFNVRQGETLHMTLNLLGPH